MTETPADLSHLAHMATRRGENPAVIFNELKAFIADAITNHPRSQQKAIGPSEVGDPCARRVAYKLADTPPARTMPPAWRPTVGTAVHSWLEEQLGAYNATNFDDKGGSRFLYEMTLDAGPCANGQLRGSCDVYDRETAGIIDWKIIGPSSYKTTRASINAGRGIKQVYRIQDHVYGLGMTNRGLPVDWVGNVFLPAAGELTDALFWHEPFNPDLARWAITRANRIHALTTSVGLTGALTLTNGQLAAINAGHLADTDGQPGEPAIGLAYDGCAFCPWLNPATTDLAAGCPGAGANARPSLAESLIA